MNLAELALEEAALKTLADAVNDRLKTVRATMQQQMEDTGVSRVDATLPDGTKVATISRPSPSQEAQVTNEELLKGWVREHTPSELTSRVVTEIRPAYLKALLAELTAAGVPQWCDKATGQIHDVPGVAVVPTRNTTHSVRPTKGGREAIAAAWRSGALAHLDLPQLTAGGER
jgi:hypothetical protein